MKKLLLASALLLSVGSVQADQSPKWDSVGISYQTVDIDGDELSGFGVSGSKLLGEDFFAVASYSYAGDEIEIYNSDLDLDLYSLSAGFGYRYSLTQNADIFGIVSYESMEAEVSYEDESESETENGYGLQIGVRTLITEQIELGASIHYIDIADTTETAFSASALFNFTDQFSAGVGYNTVDDVDTLSVSAVYFF